MEIALIKSYTNKPWRSPETYQLIESSLREKWQVTSIHTTSPETLHSSLTKLQQKNNGDIFVFNIAEYLAEETKAGFLPVLLEEWELPHLGSSAKAIALGLDKAQTKKRLKEKGVLTPQYFVADGKKADPKPNAENIAYPLIVKPIREGGHIGIKDDSIVYDADSLDKIVNRVLEVHKQPALVEAYIAGKGMREFSVGIVAGETQLFTPIEIDYAAMDVQEPILSYEAAQKDLERTKLVVETDIRDEIIDLSQKTFAAIGAQDYSRVDLRMNHTGCYVLEINTMPGLGRHSFLPKAAKDIYGLDYAQLIQKFTADSIQRQKVESK